MEDLGSKCSFFFLIVFFILHSSILHSIDVFEWKVGFSALYFYLHTCKNTGVISQILFVGRVLHKLYLNIELSN